jgi:hypothetical protein
VQQENPTDTRAQTISTGVACAILAALGIALYLPGIGSFGLWDPYEVRIADAARGLATGSAHWGDTARQLGHAPLGVWLVACGFKAIGVGELGGRLPIALVATLALLACYYAGAGLIRRRGALIGSVALASAPMVLLGARQMMTSAPLILGSALAVGGLARALWPAENSSPARQAIDLLLALAGLAIGQYSGGVVVGVIAPVAAVLVAVAAAPDIFARVTKIAALGIAVAALGVATFLAWHAPHGYSQLLGGVPHQPLSTAVFTSPLKALGFGIFPWIALLPIAGIHAVASTTSDVEPAGREWYGRIVLVAWFVALYLAGVFNAANLSEMLLPAGPAVLLLCGAYLDDLLDRDELQPFAALTVALGTIMIGRDFYLQPESYIGAHMTETLRWPGPLPTVPYFLIGFAAFFAAVIGLAMGVPLAPSSANPQQRVRGRLVLVGGAIAGALVMALLTAHYIVPKVSKTLSPRDLYGKSKQLDPSAPLGQYRFNATGSSYYTTGKAPVTLATLDDLFKFLAKPEHVFVMAGVDELPSIDQFSKQKNQAYFVVDDSNARFLMLSNRVLPNEHDVNPLKLFVSNQKPLMGHTTSIDFDGKVELIGYDLPSIVSKGEDIKLRLYFKVLSPINGAWKVFVHLDGAGSRINGDHVPLEGRFPTQYWVPGYFITDEHIIHPDRSVEQEGYHQLFMGLWMGADRMKIVTGDKDNENRARLGGLTVK